MSYGLKHDSKIGILGAGVEGLAAAEYLVRNGFTEVTIFDARENIEGVIPAGVNVSLGVDFLAKEDSSIYECEVLFRSPGIHTEKLDKARAAGIKVTSTTEYFFENCPGMIIGVTGTKGKGTTSSLIFEILKGGGRDVHLGGNIGESPLNFLDDLNSESIVILELSSFQLQDLTLSPQVAVVLMTTSEHLDYHADRNEYWDAKKPILLYQGPDDFCVLNRDYEYMKEFSNLGKGQKFIVSRYDSAEKGMIHKGAFVKNGELIYAENGIEVVIGEANKVGLLGEHNLENVLAAAAVCVKMGITIEAVRKGVYEFKGLEHRLEFVKSVDGINFYNDSFSTTPETSIAAAYAFKGPVMLIAGGSEKNSDYTEWGMMLQKNINLKAVFLIGMMADRMEKALRNAAAGESTNVPDGEDTGVDVPIKIYRCESLEEAIKTAHEIGVKGDSVVMSPAAASFDMFKNYKYRGAAFKNIVNHLTGFL